MRTLILATFAVAASNQGPPFNGTPSQDNRALGGGGYSNPLGGSTGGGIDNGTG